MSDRRLHKSKSGTYFKRGSFNAWCQRCGQKYKAEQLQEEWDGLKVCYKCYEGRHPQDMVRGILDEQSVPWASPEIADTWVIDAAIQGLTTAPFGMGPQDLFDYSNPLSVQVMGGLLANDTLLNVLNGSNLCAVKTPTQGWEVLQFVMATLTSPMNYTLSQLLRGRCGTETAMMDPLPAGSPFVFIGQSSPSNYDWMATFLNVGKIPYSPTQFACYEDNGDVVIEWVRRSRIPDLEIDNWSMPLFAAPMDCPDETYQIDILNGSGNVVRTLYANGRPRVIYEYSDILTDFGAVQTSISIIGYQVDNTPGVGRGYGRPATLSVVISTAHDMLGDGFGDSLCDQVGRLLGG